MNSFRRLPFILSAVMAVIVGVASYLSGVENQGVYTRMIIVMVVFFIIGRYAAKSLEAVKKEVDDKNAEIEREKKLQEEKEREAELAAEKQKEAGKGQNINLAAVDEEDDFEPLTVSRVISNKINE